MATLNGVSRAFLENEGFGLKGFDIVTVDAACRTFMEVFH